MNRFENRREKWETIERMYYDGASVFEMMEETGYTEGTVKSVLTSLFPQKKPGTEKLNFAQKVQPEVKRIIVDGKIYQDITELFLSTEWEGAEVGV